MLDQSLRLPKKWLLAPLARRLKVHPNAITGAGLVSGLAAAVAAAAGEFTVGLGFWLGNRFLDGLDGEVASAQGKKSDLGGYFDIMADLAVYAAVPVALTLAVPQPPWILLAVLLGCFYLNLGSWTYLSSILEKRGHGAQANAETTAVTMPPGLIEGGETVLFYTLFFLFPARLNVLFGLMALLTLITVFQRLGWARRNL